MLEHRQFAEPALDAADFAFQAHQLLSATALVVLQRILLVAVVFGLNGQFFLARTGVVRSEEHTSELQSLMRISYAVFCLKKKNKKLLTTYRNTDTQSTTQRDK